MKEKYYYIFRYVDGSEQEFIQDNNTLSSKIANLERKRIHLDDVIINLDNVIKVTVETQSERNEKQQERDKSHRKTLDALESLDF